MNEHPAGRISGVPVFEKYENREICQKWDQCKEDLHSMVPEER
jgi:hypothetical protein